MPVQDGFQSLLSVDPKTLVNPVALTPGSIQHGKQAYGYFCVHCHGPNADGLGTVGMSFSPLPRRSAVGCGAGPVGWRGSREDQIGL